MPKNVWKPMHMKKITTEPAGKTEEEKKQKELERKRAQKARKAERELNPDVAPLTEPSSAPLPPSPPPPFHFASNTAAFTLTRDGLPPPPSWVFTRFAEAFTDRERAFAGAHGAHVILHELLADALRFGWESGMKKGRAGGTEGIQRGPVLVQPPAPAPLVCEYTTTATQTDTTVEIVPPTDTVLPLALSEPLPRDFTALHTDSSRPFGTLQRRLARLRRSTHYADKNSTVIHTPSITQRRPTGISTTKPVTTTPGSVPPSRPARRHILDWDRDPLLSDLSRALGALGWVRRVG
ncbi:hypothetical protein C8R47DRAFT_1074588 [Mycena vitilis]|nr:hypothetical protein C8R47DRAFT_1074588 [Mycena vitilis]